MRAYQLHNASWSRIVTQRVRRPEAIASRLESRRRPESPVPADGQLVLLSCNHTVDPRTSTLVDRRELLDRIIEALSIADVDGVIASADLLEELTLLNVLEHRLAFCTASGDAGSAAAFGRRGVSSSTVASGHFDGALLSHRWHVGSAHQPPQPWSVAADVAEFAAYRLPTILNLVVAPSNGQSEFDTSWSDWIDPIHQTSSAMATGAGVWMSVPAINGLSRLAELAAFPILLRDTDIPIAPSAWGHLFESDLPLTVRGMIPGVSALFPLEGSVAEATAAIARSVRQRGVLETAA